MFWHILAFLVVSTHSAPMLFSFDNNGVGWNTNSSCDIAECEKVAETVKLLSDHSGNTTSFCEQFSECMENVQANCQNSAAFEAASEICRLTTTNTTVELTTTSAPTSTSISETTNSTDLSPAGATEAGFPASNATTTSTAVPNTTTEVWNTTDGPSNPSVSTGSPPSETVTPGTSSAGTATESTNPATPSLSTEPTPNETDAPSAPSTAPAAPSASPATPSVNPATPPVSTGSPPSETAVTSTPPPVTQSSSTQSPSSETLATLMPTWVPTLMPTSLPTPSSLTVTCIEKLRASSEDDLKYAKMMDFVFPDEAHTQEKHEDKCYPFTKSTVLKYALDTIRQYCGASEANELRNRAYAQFLKNQCADMTGGQFPI